MSIKPPIPDDVKDARFWVSVRDTLLILLGRRGNRISKLYENKRAAAFKAGAFTRDLTAASGSQSVTGVGFKPAAILAVGGIAGGAGSTGATVGFYVPSSHYVLEILFSATTNIISDSSLAIIFTATGDFQACAVSSLDADGFTVSWTKTGSPTGTGTVGYMAISDLGPLATDLIESRQKINQILEELHGPYS